MPLRKPPIAVFPRAAVPAARVAVRLAHHEIRPDALPGVHVAGVPARVVFASPRLLGVLVPDGPLEGRAQVTVDGVDGSGELFVGQPMATEVHQVDNPVFDAAGALYVTDSGTRGQRVPVSVFRVTPAGAREPFVSGIVNATSMAFGPDGRLYVSSRFEGKVYRVEADGRAMPIGTDLGIACGLAFASDGSLFVGDRSGTILRLDPATGGARVHASLPPSIAAFHLAAGPRDTLFVTAPTLASRDHIYEVAADGTVTVVSSAFGRPQGLAMRNGSLYVAEAAAGWSGLFRVGDAGANEAIVAGTNLIGLAFNAAGEIVVATSDTVFRFDKGLRF